MSQQNHIEIQPLPSDTKGIESVTNSALKTLNQQYINKISNGIIELTHSSNALKLSPDELYDKQVKDRHLAQAQKEKFSLQKKLDYLNQSIQSIKNHNYSTSKTTPATSPSKNTPTSPTEMLKKHLQLNQKLRGDRRRFSEQKELEKQREQQKLKCLQESQAKHLQSQKTKRKQQIYQNMQKIKTRMEQRQTQLRQQQQNYRKIITQTTLFKKLQKEDEQHQNSILEQRKKKLANIRNFHKPISMAEIEQHEKKFFEVLREKQSFRERQRSLSNSDQYKVSYKSPHHQLYSQQYTQYEDNSSKLKIDKIKQFNLHVRENFSPHIDEKKQADLQQKLKESLSIRYHRQSKDKQDQRIAGEIRNKGRRYLQELRELPKKKEDKSIVIPATQRPHYTNYLTHSQRIGGKSKWGSILDSNLTKREKAIQLQMEAQKTQSSLRMKEVKARVFRKDPNEVDQQYYEMIKAKLQLMQI